MNALSDYQMAGQKLEVRVAADASYFFSSDFTMFIENA